MKGGVGGGSDNRIPRGGSGPSDRAGGDRAPESGLAGVALFPSDNGGLAAKSAPMHADILPNAYAARGPAIPFVAGSTMAGMASRMGVGAGMDAGMGATAGGGPGNVGLGLANPTPFFNPLQQSQLAPLPGQQISALSGNAYPVGMPNPSNLTQLLASPNHGHGLDGAGLDSAAAASSDPTYVSPFPSAAAAGSGSLGDNMRMLAMLEQQQLMHQQQQLQLHQQRQLALLQSQLLMGAAGGTSSSHLPPLRGRLPATDYGVATLAQNHGANPAALSSLMQGPADMGALMSARGTGDRPSSLELTSDEADWEENFRALVEFKRERGHSNVPLRHTLGHWVRAVRLDYKLFVAGKLHGGVNPGSLLTPERIARLQGIDFLWKTTGRTGTENLWMMRFTQLSEFNKANGHSSVPQKYEKIPQLGIW